MYVKIAEKPLVIGHTEIGNHNKEIKMAHVVMMVGFPASGKSTKVKEYVDKGYELLSRDLVGGRTRDLIPALEKELKDGNSVVLDYICNNCEAAGVKLWRETNTLGCWVKPLCTSCVKDIKSDEIEKSLRAYGSDDFSYPNSHHLGGLVPAVPTQEGDTKSSKDAYDGYMWWGFTSVPELGVEWWDNLPEVVEETSIVEN